MRTLSGTSVWRLQSRYTLSRRECCIKFPQNQRCRAKIALHPPKSRWRTFLLTPLLHFPLIHSRQGARRAGGGYRGTFGFRKRIALQGGVAATITPVAPLCATKWTSWGRPSKPWKNKHLGVDIHDPNARTMTPGVTKNLQAEKLRADSSFPP